MFFGKRFHGHSSRDLSGLDILVLSIIKNNARSSGYDLSQAINKRFKGMWKASPGTIYPLLSRLAARDYLKIEEITDNNRQKKLYSITESGVVKLKEVLEGNLRNSIDTIQDYIMTLTKAIPPIARNISDCFCGMPDRNFYNQEKIEESDYSRKNIELVKTIIKQLVRDKKTYSERLKTIDQQLEHHRSILENLETGREKHAKVVEIVDDDNGFDDF